MTKSGRSTMQQAWIAMSSSKLARARGEAPSRVAASASIPLERPSGPSSQVARRALASPQATSTISSRSLNSSSQWAATVSTLLNSNRKLVVGSRQALGRQKERMLM